MLTPSNYLRNILIGKHKSYILIASITILLILFLSNNSFVFANNDWKQANLSRNWSFPRDYGAHPEFRTEWWYFTGNLFDIKGNKYGYQLTLFRNGLSNAIGSTNNPWILKDLYLAHFAITDVAGKCFFYDDRISRTGPNLAGASTKKLEVWLLNWSVRQVGNSFQIYAKNNKAEIILLLSVDKPVVLHGNKGLVQKGDHEGQASYYYSHTHLSTKGSLKTPLSTTAVQVSGISWFDHEFGSNQLNPNQAGWDWISLHLSDERDLMIYSIRRIDGTIESASSATIVNRLGQTTHITHSQMRINVLDYWKSSKSGAHYPSRWKISIPSEGIQVTVAPLLADQELITPQSTNITYWEGAVEGNGTSHGKAIHATGYIELTGYAKFLGGLF
jgi:predicted secreted hydrolase